MMIASLLALTVIVRSFDVELKIDREARTVRGIERIELSSGREALRLPLKGQTVDAVSCGDRPLAFTAEGSMLTVESCAAGSVTIHYTAQEPKGITFTPSIVYTTFDTCTWMICDDAPSQRAPIDVLRKSEGMVRFFENAAGRSLPGHRYTQLIVKGSAAQEKSTFSIIGAAGHRV